MLKCNNQKQLTGASYGLHTSYNKERTCLYTLLDKKESIRGIARALRRSPSTVSREIKRNSCIVGNSKGYLKYYPTHAEKQYNIIGEKNVIDILNMIMMMLNLT